MDDSSSRTPEEEYEFLKRSADEGNMPEWVVEEMEYLWNNPQDYAKGEALDDELKDEPLYLLFRLGVAFGTTYERGYPANGEWNDEP